MKKMIGFVVLAMVAVTMAACSGSAGDKKGGAADVSAKDILDGIKEQVVKDIREVVADDKMTDEEILQSYLEVDLLGSETEDPSIAMFLEKLALDKEKLEEGYVLAAMFNVNSDEIIVLKAKDEADVESLKASLQKELDAQIQTWSQYLPDQYEKVKNNVLKTNGKYLLYVTYGNPEEVEKIFDEKLK